MIDFFKKTLFGHCCLLLFVYSVASFSCLYSASVTIENVNYYIETGEVENGSKNR